MIEVAQRMRQEGIVSKRADQPYRDENGDVARCQPRAVQAI
jgi:ATP-dependent DNA ligase